MYLSVIRALEASAFTLAPSRPRVMGEMLGETRNQISDEIDAKIAESQQKSDAGEVAGKG